MAVPQTLQYVTDLPLFACQSREGARSLQSCSPVGAQSLCSAGSPDAVASSRSGCSCTSLPAERAETWGWSSATQGNPTQALLARSLAPQQQAGGLEPYERDLKTHGERQRAGRRRTPGAVRGGLRWASSRPVREGDAQRLPAQRGWCCRGTRCSLAQSRWQTGAEALGAELASPPLKQPCQSAAQGRAWGRRGRAGGGS